MSRSYCNPVGELSIKSWAMTLITIPSRVVQECSNLAPLLREYTTSRLSSSMVRFPDVTLHSSMTSCSSPRHAIPVSPCSNARWLGKPYLQEMRRLEDGIRFPISLAVKSTWYTGAKVVEIKLEEIIDAVVVGATAAPGGGGGKRLDGSDGGEFVV